MRPKRAAAIKSITKNKEKDPEEDGLDLSEESDDDFSSASSDEFDPTKEKGNEETFEGSESEVESEDDESDEEGDSETAEDSPVKKGRFRGKQNRSSFVASLRGTTGNKFKRKSSGNLQEILQRSQFQKKKSILDDSQSGTRDKTPEFDCSGGLRLSDSEGSDDDGPSTSTKVLKNGKSSSNLSKNTQQTSESTMVDLKSLHDRYQQMENDKAKLLNYTSKKIDSQKENLNIADLLAMGESESSKKRHRNTQETDSDDGWEEVEEEGDGEVKTSYKKGVEIVLNDFNQDHRKKQVAKAVDLEAQLKRKINRQRKEFQLVLHKSNLILWVAHGNFVNRKINDSNLMKTALELLPKNKNHCYPKDKTDLDYFQQITTWFKSTISVPNQNMYCEFKKRPQILTSLALQMKFKKAICRRDYVLIFAVLLRAIGIQCRVVQSLVCAPILPPKSELISLAKKPEEKSKSSKSSSSANKSKSSRSRKSSGNHSKSISSKKSPEKSSRSSRSKSKKASEPEKIPQLDGGDDKPTTRSRKPLKLKALKGFENGEESYVDLNKDENESPKPDATKLAPRVRFSLDSPNRAASLEASKKTGSATKDPVKNLKEKATLKATSPRKTRSMSRDDSPAPKVLKETKKSAEKSQKGEKQEGKTSKTENSKKTEDNAKKSQENSKKMDNLKVFSPRRLRSRSRSNDDDRSKTTKPEVKKPNRKILSKAQETDRKRLSSEKPEVDAKKVKVSSSRKRAGEETKEVPKKKAKKSEEIDEDSDSSAKYFKPKKSSKKSSTSSKPSTSVSSRMSTSIVDRRVLSSDSETEATQTSPSKKSKRIDIWVEVYSEADDRWVAIDVFKGKIDCVQHIVKAATHPLVYVFAWNNDNSLKDVSARYCPNLNTIVRKMRVDDKYLDSIIGQFAGQKTVRDKKEDDQLNQLQLEKPMPTSIALFKKHPLYALRRHLLKYEALYPPEPPILGYIREEAIYPRDCVFVLHTRETWLKEARVVKLNEVPYKMTKTMKWDNVTKKLLRDVPQELFGIWQTKDYEPPVAENGIVPRNAYGNVELFKPSMLPIGTVHLQLPGLNKVCKKIGVDCSQAIVGFDSNGGWPFPVYDGFIICKEFEEKVIDAWNREQEIIEKREQEKYEKRVYGNWKKLIKGLLIRQRLKNKYNFEGDEN